MHGPVTPKTSILYRYILPITPAILCITLSVPSLRIGVLGNGLWFRLLIPDEGLILYTIFRIHGRMVLGHR